MHLKRFTDLGLRILMHLANEADPDKTHSVPELSEILCWNQNLVIKTAHAMRAALLTQVEVPSPDGRTRLEVLAGDRHWVFEVRFAQGAHDLAGQLEAGARRVCESSGRDRLHGNKCLHAALIFDSAQRCFVALEAEEGAGCRASDDKIKTCTF